MKELAVPAPAAAGEPAAAHAARAVGAERLALGVRGPGGLAVLDSLLPRAGLVDLERPGPDLDAVRDLAVAVGVVLGNGRLLRLPLESIEHLSALLAC